MTIVLFMAAAQAWVYPRALELLPRHYPLRRVLEINGIWAKAHVDAVGTFLEDPLAGWDSLIVFTQLQPSQVCQ